MSARNVLLAALLVLGAFTSSAVAQVPLPEQKIPALAEMLRHAAAQSPRMLDQILNLEIAENDRISARANLLPTMGGYFRDYETRDERADQPGRLRVHKVAYDVNISQPVFSWGERRNYARMGEIRQKIAQGNVREAYRILAVEIRSQYLYLVSQKIALERAKFNQKFTQDQLRIAEDKYAKKIISDLDIFAPRLTAEQAQITLERTEFEYANLKQALARMTGLPEVTDDMVADAVPKPEPYNAVSFDGLVDEFSRQKELPNNDAAALRHTIELDDLDYRNQKVRLLPKLSFTVGLNQDEQSYSLNVAQRYAVNSAYAGFTVNWTIFDSFSSAAATRTALAHRRQHQNQYADLNARLVAQARVQARQIYFSARNLSIQERFLDSAAGNLKSKQEEFQRGLISEADVSQVRLALYDNQINAGNIRAEYYQRVSDLLGTLNADPVTAQTPSKP